MAVDRNALRRLQRILDSEEYGPKLVRLNKSGQRIILDKIERGDKDVRKSITELDRVRREKNTAVAHARKDRAAAGEQVQSVGPVGPDWRQAARTMGLLAAERVPDRVFNPDAYVWEAQGNATLRDWDHYLSLRGSPEAMVQEARWKAKTNDSYSVFWYHFW